MTTYRAYVYNLSWETKADVLKAHFGTTLGDSIVGVKILMDDKGRSRGAAHVSFSSADAVEQLIKEYHKTFFMGRELQIVHAKEKTAVPVESRAAPYTVVRPQRVYMQSAPVYREEPVYPQPAPMYAQPAAYAQAPPVYTQATPVYTRAPPVYAQQPPVYTQRRPVYAQPPPEYDEEQQIVRVEYHLVPRRSSRRIRTPAQHRQPTMDPETGEFKIEF